MKIEILQPKADHGSMIWTGRFDDDGRAIFVCPLCGRSIAMGGPAEPRLVLIEQGDFWATHQAYITLEIWRAALELELWPQTSQTGALMRMWEESGGGPLLGSVGVSIQP